MAEYIEREMLMLFPIRRDHYDKENGDERFINGIESVLEFAERLPAADVAPVVHGRWEHGCICSSCTTHCGPENKTTAPYYRYCPFCGAKMDLEG